MTDLESNAKVLQVEGYVSRYLAALIALPPFFRMVAFFGMLLGSAIAGWIIRGLFS